VASENIGERIAALSASFDAEKEYQHGRWHKLDNDLTPLVNLPERMTRDIARLHGVFEGRINGATREIERGVESAIERAMKPINRELMDIKKTLHDHDGEIGELKTWRAQWTAVRLTLFIVGQALLNVIAAVGTLYALGGGKLP
jgi:hypothetical protein